MQIVIDIPEEKYTKLVMEEQHIRACGSYYSVMILDGIPLPKGHGRLKDTDAICKDIISALGIRDENYLLEAEEAIYKRIKNAPTIIEADIPTTPTVINNGSDMLSAEEIDNLLQALAKGESEE